MLFGISDMVLYLFSVYVLDVGMLFAVIKWLSIPYHLVHF